MFYKFLPVLCPIISALVLVVGLRFLKSPSSHVTQVGFNATRAPFVVEHRPLPKVNHFENLNAYDFNIERNNQKPTNTTLSGANNDDVANRCDSNYPIASPFLLASIELATLSAFYGIRYLLDVRTKPSIHGSDEINLFKSIISSPSDLHDTQSIRSSLVLLFTFPIMIFCAAAQFFIWSPFTDHYSMLNSDSSIGSFLIIKLLVMGILAKPTTFIRGILSSPSKSNAMSMVFSFISLIGLYLVFLIPEYDGHSITVWGKFVYPVLCLLLACLFPWMTWVTRNALLVMRISPLLLAAQAMIASVVALCLSLITQTTALTKDSIYHLALFAFLSLLVSSSRTFRSTQAIIFPVEILRDQLSLILAWMLCFTNSSGHLNKFVFLILATGVIFSWKWIPFSLGDSQVSKTVPSSSEKADNQYQISNCYFTKFRFISFVSVLMGLYLAFFSKPISTIRPTCADISGQRQIVTVNGVGINHLHDAVPSNYAIDHISTVYLEEAPHHLYIPVTPTKSSRPFNLYASQIGLSHSSINYHAYMPHLTSIPKRDWDDGARKVPSHAADLSFEHIQIAISSNSGAFDRIAFTINTWAKDTRVNWTVFWSGEDDPNGMTGENSFMLESFKKMTGRYPVVMEGMPGRQWSSNIKWFKMLPYLYNQAHNSTRWFFICDDDTILFPNALLHIAKTIPENPLTTSLYIGDITENNASADLFGRDMAYGGGGVLISRHLAKRINDRFEWCLDNVREHEGDGLLKSCIHMVTESDGLGRVGLTRIPVFNQMDLYEWKRHARPYLSAKLSRVAPVTLHHPSLINSLMIGMSNPKLALYEFWHLVHKIPLNLRFRRFFLQLEGGQTAVITHGLHVRVYHKRVFSVEHNVDWDSDIPRSPRFVGPEFLLEKKTGFSVRSRGHDFTDFWLLHNANNTLVYSNEQYNFQFRVKCKRGNVNALHLCTGSS